MSSEDDSPSQPASRLVRIGFQSGSGEGETTASVALEALGAEASLEFEFLHPRGLKPGPAGDQGNETKGTGDKDSSELDEAADTEADKVATEKSTEHSNEPNKMPLPLDDEEGGLTKEEAEKPVNCTEEAKSEPEANQPATEKITEQSEEPSGQEQQRRQRTAKPSEAESIDSNSNSNSTSSRQTRRGFRILGVEFAPLNTPMRRRLQTLAVLQSLLCIAVMPTVCTLFLLILLFTPLSPLVLAYLGWILVFDRKTSQRGGRRWERIRRWSLWKHYRDYFPISLVKSAELDPKQNYLIGYHPHGIISCGAFCNFGTEATGFSVKFPGIKPHLLTLRMNFFWPLLRGYYMASGLCDVSKPSIEYILGRQGGGNAAIIVVGGAQEALDARPGNYCLTLRRRKGFVRMALQTGAQLVPCFSFGENDLFRQASNPPGSRVRAFQQLFKGAMGSSPPLFYGRGVFNYTFGLMPFRHEIITVVGAPIAVTKCAEPTAEQVDALHQEYMARLSDLFDQHKARYGVPEDVKLEFV